MTMMQPDSIVSKQVASRSNAAENEMITLQPAPSSASFHITLDPEGHK